MIEPSSWALAKAGANKKHSNQARTIMLLLLGRYCVAAAGGANSMTMLRVAMRHSPFTLRSVSS